jgi:hypothetical protein
MGRGSEPSSYPRRRVERRRIPTAPGVTASRRDHRPRDARNGGVVQFARRLLQVAPPSAPISPGHSPKARDVNRILAWTSVQMPGVGARLAKVCSLIRSG